MTQVTGVTVLLPAGSVNRVEVTRTVSVLGVASTLDLLVLVSDDASESAFYTLRARLTVT